MAGVLIPPRTERASVARQSRAGQSAFAKLQPFGSDCAGPPPAGSECEKQQGMDHFDLGTYRRPISTTSAEAQRWFDIGLNWCRDCRRNWPRHRSRPTSRSPRRACAGRVRSQTTAVVIETAAAPLLEGGLAVSKRRSSPARRRWCLP
ncbi:hypothetical protein CK220_29480 [Mesorhizobium sp. WSM3860]|nr:hypothetical protein CK220_29480 [Mesorhizobium sp. WSM3860]